MLDFVKKLFGFRSETPQPTAPYKIEPQLNSDNNIIKVDVGNLQPEQAVQEVEEVVEKVKKKRTKKATVKSEENVEVKKPKKTSKTK